MVWRASSDSLGYGWCTPGCGGAKRGLWKPPTASLSWSKGNARRVSARGGRKGIKLIGGARLSARGEWERGRAEQVGVGWLVGLSGMQASPRIEWVGKPMELRGRGGLWAKGGFGPGGNRSLVSF